MYRGVLKSDGRAVAIKIQRPGLVQAVTKDLYVLKRAVGVYQKLSDRRENIDLTQRAGRIGSRTTSGRVRYTARAPLVRCARALLLSYGLTRQVLRVRRVHASLSACLPFTPAICLTPVAPLGAICASMCAARSLPFLR